MEPAESRSNCDKSSRSCPPVLLLLGPLPPPLFGPAIATRIILNSALKHEFSIIHLNTNTHRELKSLGKFHLSSFIGNLRLYIRMLCLIIGRMPDLVLVPISQTTTGFLKDSIYIWICWLLRRRTILQLRGGNFKNWFDSCSGWQRRYIAFVLGKAQAVIVLGEKLRHLFAEFYPPNRIFVVPNGLDVDLPVAPSREEDTLRLLYLSNLQPAKGIEDLLSALSLIVREAKATSISLDVVGNWTDEKQCNRLFQQCWSEELPVRFHQAVDNQEKFEYLVKSDLFVFTPRKQEGHPWVIIEAMAASLPIISTDQGAITESVIDGVNGFIVEPQSPDQIAEKISLLMKDPCLRRQMGDASRRLYLQNFTEENMVSGLTTVFNTVIGLSQNR